MFPHHIFNSQLCLLVPILSRSTTHCGPSLYMLTEVLTRAQYYNKL